ncbi:MAG TPA: DUF433 domain-containing protein [Candidatus Binataceae bacterium]|nr:DUF433 domain-containing protein [Candidatus Binataceae bacterium]
MADAVREIQLRNAERTWATLRIEADGKKVLCHQLSEADLAQCPTLLPYEDAEQLYFHLLAGKNGPCVELGGTNGMPKVTLVEGDDGELYEVADPRGDARLVVAPADGGTFKIATVHEGGLTLKACRIKSDPQIMIGNPVIRGTRITVEFLLRRIAGGATLDELLEDYPQLSREDIQEALVYAANFLRTKTRVLARLETPKL